MDSYICSCCSEEYSSNYNTRGKIMSNLEAYLTFLVYMCIKLLEMDTLRLFVTLASRTEDVVAIRTHRERKDEEIEVQEFLAYDICSVYADKYILAIIFKYLMRWNMGAVCFSKNVFFMALNIAKDVFEDIDQEMQTDLYMWTLGSGFQNRIREFTDTKIQFFFELGLKTLVCKKWCERLFEMVPGHSAWQRVREEGHAGAHRPVLEAIEDGLWAVKFNRGECSHCLRRNELLRVLPEINMHEE